MSERGFDELLEEERAFVLRHLSGRDEYERMRALLGHLRDEGRDQEPLEAHPVVKERVLAAFREAQQPTWRIWLNSLGGWLFPPQAQGFWRPALAFATLAVVVTAGVLGYQRLADRQQQQVAEVRREKAEQPEPAPVPADSVGAPTPSAQQPDRAEEEQPAPGTITEPAEVRYAEVVEDDEPLRDAVLEEEAEEAAPATTRLEALDAAPAAAIARVDEDSFADELQVSEDLAEGTAVMVESHYTSTADVQVMDLGAKASRKAAKDQADGMANVAMEDRSLAANPGLMALLQPGW